MEIPIKLFGTTKEVRKKLSGLATYLKRHNDLPPGFIQPVFSTKKARKKYPDTKVLFSSDRLRGGERHFRPYMFYDHLFRGKFFGDEDNKERIQLLFRRLTLSPWGILVLLSDHALIPDFTEDREEAIYFFRYFYQEFEEFNDPVFSEDWGQHKEAGFWNVNRTSLFRYMLKAGVPLELFSTNKNSYQSTKNILDWINRYILVQEQETHLIHFSNTIKQTLKSLCREEKERWKFENWNYHFVFYQMGRSSVRIRATIILDGEQYLFLPQTSEVLKPLALAIFRMQRSVEKLAIVITSYHFEMLPIKSKTLQIGENQTRIHLSKKTHLEAIKEWVLARSPEIAAMFQIILIAQRKADLSQTLMVQFSEDSSTFELEPESRLSSLILAYWAASGKEGFMKLEIGVDSELVARGQFSEPRKIN